MRMYQILCVPVFVIFGGCFAGLTASSPPPAYQPPATNNDAFASSMGYPTRHTAAEFEAFLAKNLEGYKPLDKPIEGKLDALTRIPVKLERGMCYFIVLRLAEGAKYSDQAQAGLRFDFEPKGGGSQISGGPGVYGPGGAGSAGCPQQNADYEFVLRTFVGASEKDLGTGPITLQLYSKPVSEEQLTNLKADQDRQIEESKRFQAEQRAKEAERARIGCAKCEARYQGCRGAGRGVGSCQSDFRSCSFQEVGASWMSACRQPVD